MAGTMSSSDTITCPSCGEQIPTDYVVCPYDGYSLVKELRQKVRTKIRLKEGIGRAYRLLRQPMKNTDRVMEEVATNYDRKGPLVVLFLISFLMAFRVAPYSNAYLSGTTVAPEMGFILILGLVSGFMFGPVVFIFGLILWYGISLVVHYAGKLLSSSVAGTAEFKETQSVVGYALTPLVLGLFLLNILFFFVLPEGNIYNQQAASSFFETVVVGYNSDVAGEIELFYMVFYALFATWSVVICGVGFEKVHRVPKVQSFGVPAAVALLYGFVAFIL